MLTEDDRRWAAEDVRGWEHEHGLWHDGPGSLDVVIDNAEWLADDSVRSVEQAWGCVYVADDKRMFNMHRFHDILLPFPSQGYSPVHNVVNAEAIIEALRQACGWTKDPAGGWWPPKVEQAIREGMERLMGGDE